MKGSLPWQPASMRASFQTGPSRPKCLPLRSFNRHAAASAACCAARQRLISEPPRLLSQHSLHHTAISRHHTAPGSVEGGRGGACTFKQSPASGGRTRHAGGDPQSGVASCCIDCSASRTERRPGRRVCETLCAPVAGCPLAACPHAPPPRLLGHLAGCQGRPPRRHGLRPAQPTAARFNRGRRFRPRCAAWPAARPAHAPPGSHILDRRPILLASLQHRTHHGAARSDAAAAAAGGAPPPPRGRRRAAGGPRRRGGPRRGGAQDVLAVAHARAAGVLEAVRRPELSQELRQSELTE